MAGGAVTLGRVPTPAALPLPTALPSAKGPQAGQWLPSERCREPLGWQGFAPHPLTLAPLVRQPHVPSARLRLLSVPRTSNAAKLPDYLVRKRRAAGRFGSLSLAARCISQRPTSLLAHHQPSPEAEEPGVGGVLRLGTSLAGWRPPLRPAPSRRLSKPVCLSVSRYIM